MIRLPRNFHMLGKGRLEYGILTQKLAYVAQMVTGDLDFCEKFQKRVLIVLGSSIIMKILHNWSGIEQLQ